jgi:hypothetical protein
MEVKGKKISALRVKRKINTILSLNKLNKKSIVESEDDIDISLIGKIISTETKKIRTGNIELIENKFSVQKGRKVKIGYSYNLKF